MVVAPVPIPPSSLRVPRLNESLFRLFTLPLRADTRSFRSFASRNVRCSLSFHCFHSLRFLHHHQPPSLDLSFFLGSRSCRRFSRKTAVLSIQQCRFKANVRRDHGRRARFDGGTLLHLRNRADSPVQTLFPLQHVRVPHGSPLRLAEQLRGIQKVRTNEAIHSQSPRFSAVSCELHGADGSHFLHSPGSCSTFGNGM